MGAVEYTPEQLQANAEIPIAEPSRDPRVVLWEISRRHGVPAEKILGRGRSASVSGARLALYRALRAMKMSYPEIGKFVGRDHTTVLAVLRYAEDVAYREKTKLESKVWMGARP